MDFQDRDFRFANDYFRANAAKQLDPSQVYPLLHVGVFAIGHDIARSSIADAIEPASLSDPVIGCYLHDSLDSIGDQPLDRVIDAIDGLLEGIDVKYLTRGPIAARVNDMQSATPAGVAELSRRILDIEPDDTVVDYGSGIGSFLESAYSACKEASYIGIEADDDALAIAKIRSYHSESPVSYMHGDMFGNGPIPAAHSANKVFSNYPWGFRTSDIDTLEIYVSHIHPNGLGYKLPMRSDWLFNQLVVDSLDRGGIGVAVATAGACFNASDRPARQHFIEQGYIKAVIALPKGVFAPYTNIDTQLLILCPGGSENIRFVDASTLGVRGRRATTLDNKDIDAILSMLHEDGPHSLMLSIKDVATADYDLSASKLFQEHVELANPVPLESVSLSIRRGARFMKSDLDELACEEDTGIDYPALSDINDGAIEYPVQHIKELYPHCSIVEDEDILLSKQGSPYKVAVARVDNGRKVLANGNLYVITVDRKELDPYYLAAFMSSPKGQMLLDQASKGTSVRNLPIKLLSKFQIPLADMEEQRRIGAVYRKSVEHIQELNAQIASERDSIAHLFDPKE